MDYVPLRSDRTSTGYAVYRRSDLGLLYGDLVLVHLLWVVDGSGYSVLLCVGLLSYQPACNSPVLFMLQVHDHSSHKRCRRETGIGRAGYGGE